MYMGTLPALLSVHCVHMWGPWKPKEGMGFPGTGVTDSYELPCGAGNQTWSSGRAAVLLLAEPSLLAHEYSFKSHPTPT